MTNQEIINLGDGLQGVRNLSGIKFAYVVSKNINKVKSEIETFNEMQKFSKEYEEYNKERIALCELHATKDDEGKPVTTPIKNNIGVIIATRYNGLEGNKAFEAQLEVLNDKHKDVIALEKKKEEDFNAFLKEESKVELHKLDVNDVPKEITGGQLNGISLIITGELK